MADEITDVTATPAAVERSATSVASELLRKLGYNADDGGPLYYVALAKFLQAATDEEKKQADSPAGLVLVLRKRLDAKLNAEAEAKGVPVGYIIGGLAALGLLWWLVNKDD